MFSNDRQNDEINKKYFNRLVELKKEEIKKEIENQKQLSALSNEIKPLKEDNFKVALEFIKKFDLSFSNVENNFVYINFFGKNYDLIIDKSMKTVKDETITDYFSRYFKDANNLMKFFYNSDRNLCKLVTMGGMANGKHYDFVVNKLVNILNIKKSIELYKKEKKEKEIELEKIKNKIEEIDKEIFDLIKVKNIFVTRYVTNKIVKLNHKKDDLQGKLETITKAINAIEEKIKSIINKPKESVNQQQKEFVQQNLDKLIEFTKIFNALKKNSRLILYKEKAIRKIENQIKISTESDYWKEIKKLYINQDFKEYTQKLVNDFPLDEITKKVLVDIKNINEKINKGEIEIPLQNQDENIEQKDEIVNDNIEVKDKKIQYQEQQEQNVEKIINSLIL